MEACGCAHFLGRALREQGHEVRLIPAQDGKPYVMTNKSDYIDAEAIAEAVARPTMRFVPIKSANQLDLQSLHRVRELVEERRRRMELENRLAPIVVFRPLPAERAAATIKTGANVLISGLQKLSGVAGGLFPFSLRPQLRSKKESPPVPLYFPL
jgi:transposase